MMEMEEISPPNRWVRLLYYLWKIFTCLFLHLLLIAVVIGYCFFGMFMFQKLEEQYEKDMKVNITYIRANLTQDIWKFTETQVMLEEVAFTSKVREELKSFEAKLVWAMRKGGWNGNESVESLQWTQGGALFYSIIVITTIGYGHIAPKTPQGKIATIFYAIVGIPLMLLCLSNIGDVMAHSFRFIYWRIFCYKCTQPPKRIPFPSRRARSFRGTVRSHGNRFSGRSRTTSFRQSGRNSQKSADSAIAMSETYTRSSYSDTECRYYDEMEQESVPGEKFFNRQSQQSRYSDNVTMYQSPRGAAQHSSYKSRPAAADPAFVEYGDCLTRNSPVVFNKYALEREESCRIQTKNRDRKYRQGRGEMLSKDDSMVGSRRMLGPSGIATLPRAAADYPPRFRRDRPHGMFPMAAIGRHKENIGPSPRIMSPLGFAVHRQTFPRAARDYYMDDYYDYYNDYSDYYQQDYTRPVPIWLCVFLVVSYIIGGAFLFNEQQQNWGFFNSAYFCFITLTTIGFGDYVPEQKMGQDAKLGTAICSLYLLLGIALLAMSFNLVQEEVINNVKSVARHLGIIKDEDSDE